MKLGIAYNVFDGVSNLKYSIKNIRPVCDYIVAVYQTVSNHGNEIDQDVLKVLQSLRIHSIILYTPDLTKSPHWNECRKRNIGMEAVRSAGCDYFMTMDCDELYNLTEFKRAMHMVEIGGYDASACQMQTYYGNSKMVYKKAETYYVPLIYKLTTDPSRYFREYVKWDVLADPTRKLPSSQMLIFTRDQIQMHHLSYVRDDIRCKLINSSALPNYRDRVEDIVNAYKVWDGGNKGLTVHGWVDLIEAQSLNVPLPKSMP